MATLVNDLTGLFKSQALGVASAQLGESEGSIMNGFQAAIASIIGGLSSKTGQTGVMGQIFDLIRSPANDTGVLDNVRSFFSGGNPAADTQGLSGRFLSMLFGGQQTRVADEIGRSAGLRSSSASTMLSMAAPLVLGMLGKRVQQDHLDVSSLSNLVRNESSSIRNLLPSGLANMFGMGSTAAATGAAGTGATYTTMHPIETAPTNRWLWPLLLGIAALALLGWWMVGRGREQVRNTATRTATSLGEFFTVTLPNGVTLNIPRNGMETALIEFVKDPSRPVSATTWFDFDRLTFAPGSASLTDGSQEQLANLAAVMKAYPNTQLKIGGYTDNTGDAATNMQLSSARANTVREQLILMGIAPERLEAEGYGEQYPIADNSTEEGRARNRRISVRVTQK
jgi:OmpA-OmpF porin, OOP family